MVHNVGERRDFFIVVGRSLRVRKLTRGSRWSHALTRGGQSSVEDGLVRLRSDSGEGRP